MGSRSGVQGHGKARLVAAAFIVLLLLAATVSIVRSNSTPPAEAQDVDWLALASSASISISGLSSTIPHGGSDSYTVRVSGHGSLYSYFSVSVVASGALECSSGLNFRLSSSRTHSRTLSAYGCKAGTGTITAYLYFHSPDPKGGTSLDDDDDQEVTVVGRPTPTPRPTNTPVPTATPSPTNTPVPTATPRPTNTPVPPTPTPTPLPDPPKVTGLSVKAAASKYGPNRVQLGWSPVTGARDYIVQQSIDNGAWNVVNEPGRPQDPAARDSAALGTGGVYYAPCDKPAQYRVAAFGDGYLREAVRGPFSVIKPFTLQCSPFVGVTGGSAVTEGTNATFTLSTDIKPASVISVIVSISQIGDFTNATTTRSIPLSTTGTARFTVATIDDSTDEADGFVRAAIQSGKGYNILNARRTASVQVKDNDLPPTPTATATPSPTPTSTPRPSPVVVSISRVGSSTITEGADAIFALTASPRPPRSIDVNVSISQDGDFVKTGVESVTMNRSGRASLYISTDDDAVDEPDGSVTATLRSGNGYQIDSRNLTAKVAVHDNDLPTPPTATPAPTPTPVPQCNTKDIGDVAYKEKAQTGFSHDVEPLTEPWELMKANSFGKWVPDCLSSWKKVGTAFMPAAYYTFDLKKDSHVTIDLSAIQTGVNPLIALRKGGAQGGTPLYYNDDNEERNTFASRISRRMEEGRYTLEATLESQVPARIASSSEWPFSIKLVAAESFPQLGYQRDFTIMYYLRKTPTPGTTSHMVEADPYEIELISDEVSRAAAMWNDAVGSPWPNILFCEKGSNVQAAPPKRCDDRNTDGNAVPIDIVTSLSILTCSRKTACVDPGFSVYVRPVTSFWQFAPKFMEIESPAFYHSSSNPVERPMKWSAASHFHDNYELLGNGSVAKLRFARGVIAHELGHMAGLDDLYGDRFGHKYDGYLMGTNYAVEAIPDSDVGYIEQIYRTERGSRPH